MSKLNTNATPRISDEFFIRKTKRRRKFDSFDEAEEEKTIRVPDKGVKNLCVLSKWIFKLSINQFCVTVEGFKIENSNAKSEKYWKSTKIVEILSPTELKSESGTFYTLAGQIDTNMAKIYGYPEWLIKRFLNGFPSDWHEILHKFYENALSKGQLSTSLMESLLSESTPSVCLQQISVDPSPRHLEVDTSFHENSTPFLKVNRFRARKTSTPLKQVTKLIKEKCDSIKKSPETTPENDCKSIKFNDSGSKLTLNEPQTCTRRISPTGDVPEHRIIRASNRTPLAYYSDDKNLVVTCFANPAIVLTPLPVSSTSRKCFSVEKFEISSIKTERKLKTTKKCSKNVRSKPKIDRQTVVDSQKIKFRKKSWTPDDVNLLKKKIEEKWPKGEKEWEIISTALHRSVAACRIYAEKYFSRLKIEHVELPERVNNDSKLSVKVSEKPVCEHKTSPKKKKRKFLTLKEKRENKNALKLAAVGTAKDADFFGGMHLKGFQFKILNLLPDDLSTATTPQSIAGSSRFGDFDSESPTVDLTTTCVSDSLLRSKTVQYVHQIQRNKTNKLINVHKRVNERKLGKKTVGKVISILKNVEEKKKLNVDDGDVTSFVDDYFEADTE